MLGKKNNISIVFTILFSFYALVIALIPVIFDINGVFTVPLFIVITVVLVFFIRFLNKSKLISESNNKENLLWFFISFAITFAVLIVAFNLFDTMISPDTQSQYDQALSGEYNDWHPVAHTFLFFTIPMIFSKSLTFLTYYQLFLFALAHSYLIYTLRKNNCPRWICLLELFLSVNPLLYKFLTHVWKDIGMSIFCILLIAQYMNIVFSKGDWLRKKRNIIFVALTLACASLMRHNAILFTLPLALSLLVISKDYRKKAVSAIVCFIVVFCAIKGPVYKMADVEKPGRRVTETLGICIAIMGNVITNDPESLDEETRSFLYEVSPAEVWSENYTVGDFNYVKSNENTNLDAIDELGYKNVLLYTLKCFSASPKYCFQAFFSLTGLVWNTFYFNQFGYSVGEIISTATGKTITEPGIFRTLSENLHLGFIEISSIDFILIALAFLSIKNKSQIKNLLYIVPILCHNFGTALLLTGYDDRFFLYSYFVFIPTAYIFIRENRIIEKEEV